MLRESRLAASVFGTMCGGTTSKSSKDKRRPRRLLDRSASTVAGLLLLLAGIGSGAELVLGAIKPVKLGSDGTVSSSSCRSSDNCATTSNSYSSSHLCIAARSSLCCLNRVHIFKHPSIMDTYDEPAKASTLLSCSSSLRILAFALAKPARPAP